MDFNSIVFSSIKELKATDAEIGHIWKLPDEQDDVRFAVTEFSEAMEELSIIESLSQFGSVVNAEINAQGKDYARNNEQAETNFAKELADTGMMILKYFMARAKDSGKTEQEIIAEQTPYFLNPDGTLHHVPAIIDEALKDAGEVGLSFDAMSTIGMLLSYSLMMSKSVPGLIYVDGALTLALFLVVTHDVFSDKSFLEYLKEKLEKTKDKVLNREMHIR